MTNNKLLTVSDITKEAMAGRFNRISKTSEDVLIEEAKERFKKCEQDEYRFAIDSEEQKHASVISEQHKRDKSRMDAYFAFVKGLSPIPVSNVVKPDAPSCENKRIDEMTLDDYRRGFNKLFNGMRLR